MSYSYRSAAARRRRARFTVNVERNGVAERRVVLAYDDQGAFDYFNRLGYRVGTVRKGDYRMEAQRSQGTGGAGYVVDRQAVKDGCDLLGLRLPVKIRHNSRQGSTRGNYRFRGTSHDIMVKSYLTAEQASLTLWHELCHAMQAERCGATFEAWGALLDSERGKYRNAPTEIEARAMSATMHDVPLTRAA